jgi:hypothetical protein
MARSPDTPCSGDCGTLLWSGRGSAPAAQRMCRPCRRTRPDALVAGRIGAERASRASAPHRSGRPWRRLRDQVLAEESHCFRCALPVDKAAAPRTSRSASVDHLVDVSRGGAPLDRANVALSHLGCNALAGTRAGHGLPPLSAEEYAVALRDGERGELLQAVWARLAAEHGEDGAMLLLRGMAGAS